MRCFMTGDYRLLTAHVQLAGLAGILAAILEECVRGGDVGLALLGGSPPWNL